MSQFYKIPKYSIVDFECGKATVYYFQFGTYKIYKHLQFKTHSIMNFIIL